MPNWRDQMMEQHRRKKAAALTDPMSDASTLARQGRYTEEADTAGSTAGDAYLDYATNFDATKGLNDWATGAYKSVSEGLGLELDKLSGRAVGAGRLDTGFFDRDQGELVRSTQRDFSSQLAQRAMDAQAQQSSVMAGLGAYGQGEKDRAVDLTLSRREELVNARREKEERKRRKRGGIAGALGTVGGAVIGGVLGGPAGAMAGASAGGSLGGGW